MKKIIIGLIVLFPFLFLSCKKTKEDRENLGRQAAHEFCDCFENKSKDTCLDELKSNYSGDDYMNNDFISAFNDESYCGIKLKKNYIGSKADPEPAIVDENGF